MASCSKSMKLLQTQLCAIRIKRWLEQRRKEGGKGGGREEDRTEGREVGKREQGRERKRMDNRLNEY